MTQPKRNKLYTNIKATRWDRIRKRHSSNAATNLKSDAVKKFIEIDYIGRHQESMLNGDKDLNSILDPALVMDLRHEMFKKIPRKLPLATVAYSKNLQQCKEHNAAVEDHYIKNQLQQFRKHLQRQNSKNKLSAKKVHSLLVDNTDIMKSLESTHQHIQDFYKAPIDALKEVQDLFDGKLKKHEKLLEIETQSSVNELTNEHLVYHSENNFSFVAMHEDESQNGTEDENFNNENEENTFDFMGKRANELSFITEMADSQSEMDKNALRTPSPLENTDEVLQPLREAIEDPTALHLKFVRFEDETGMNCLKRESSTCSNTSDGIDSVISELAEEALRELQMEENIKLVEILEEDNIKINENQSSVTIKAPCYHVTEKAHKELAITGEVVPYSTSTLRDHMEVMTSSKTPEPDNFSNNEQSKIIKELFNTRVPNATAMMRKYFLKWVHYTTVAKIEREHVDSRADRVKQINIFLNKVRIEKKRLRKCHETRTDQEKNEKKSNSLENIKINKKYQTKIKVQQDIIDLQRVKLERQERIIMELKLHKLSEESKEARQELKNELKSVIRSGDPKSKAKAKCLQIIGNLKDEEDENWYRLQGKSLMMPRFLQNMQERALEREIRHEQAKQRRNQQEAEREAQRLAVEEAKRLEDEEAKRLRIEALKEKHRQEKMAKIIKERERQKFIENQRKAKEFYRKILLKRIGMEGFKRLLQRKRDNIKKCEELRQSLFKKTYFQAWFSLYSIIKARRNQKADELHNKCLKRKYVQIWLQYVYEERCKYNVAVDYHDFKLTEIMFVKWGAYTKRMQMIEETKMNQAMSHHEWHLKWKVLDCWQRLPQILKLEKETEERRQRWRLKIWELLPDYKPNRDEFNYL